MMQNPFTTTFSKPPEYSYIATQKLEAILENFSYERPSESVYKITGVRGSGKTVILAKIEEQMRRPEEKQRGWLVLDLNPNRDLLRQMAAMLHQLGYGAPDTKSTSLSLSANLLGNGGGLGYAAERHNDYFDIGVELEGMLQQAQADGKKLLVCIDEISKTTAMIQFTSEYGRWLRASYPVYFVCTGLYENMQEVCNVKNLTFFRRATTIQTEPLSQVMMSEMYKQKLGVPPAEARRMAEITLGYAYAFQEMGVLYFTKQPHETLEDILPRFKAELFAYSYEKIWEDMSENDHLLAKCLKGGLEMKRESVLQLLGAKSAIYSVYRDRLLKKGIIKSRQAYISFALPYFGEYIAEYCSN